MAAEHTEDASGDAGSRTDADLLAAHVAGEADAFAELFARHRERLWAVALRTTGNSEDAADGLQDGMVAAYRRAASYRGTAAVTTWLHRVVVNACLDRLRAARVRRTEPLPDDLDEYGGRGSPAAAHGASGGAVDGTAPENPADLAEQGERRERVLAALRTLPEEQRAALVLVDMEGYPVAQVAMMLECRVGTVKSRCARGRARLARALADLLPGAAAPGDGDGGDPGPTNEGNRPGRDAVPSPNPPRGPPEA